MAKHIRNLRRLGSEARIAATTWEIPLLAQLGSLKVDNSTRAQVIAVLSA